VKIYVCLTGLKTSGKTTAVKIIKDLMEGSKVQEVMIAKKLKDAVSEVFNIPPNYFEDQNIKEESLGYPVFLTKRKINKIYSAFDIECTEKQLNIHLGKELDTPRQIAQYVGTEMLRDVDSDIHCKKIDFDKDVSVYIVSDMRFISEFNFFFSKSSEGMFLPCYISNEAASDKLFSLPEKERHTSELEVLEVANKCVRIDNNSSLDHLKDEIHKKIIKKVHSFVSF
jgi:hypothetical protein